MLGEGGGKFFYAQVWSTGTSMTAHLPNNLMVGGKYGDYMEVYGLLYIKGGALHSS